MAGAPASRPTELRRRIISGLVMMALALLTAVAGGLLFLVCWSLIAAGILLEWLRLLAGRQPVPVLVPAAMRPALAAGWLLLAATAMLSVSAGLSFALLLVLAAGGGAGVALLVPAGRRLWSGVGAAYAAAMLGAVLTLRLDDPDGLIAILFLFAIVWGTDTGAFFVGRAVGGPKLWPRLSPNKTWSGAAGGAAAGIAAGMALLAAGGVAPGAAHALLAALLALAAIGGDLIESFLKRHCDAKDAGRLIPGHGGLLDRLDGFMAAAVTAGVIGAAHAATGHMGEGLIRW